MHFHCILQCQSTDTVAPAIESYQRTIINSQSVLQKTKYRSSNRIHTRSTEPEVWLAIGSPCLLSAKSHLTAAS